MCKNHICLHPCCNPANRRGRYAADRNTKLATRRLSDAARAAGSEAQAIYKTARESAKRAQRVAWKVQAQSDLERKVDHGPFQPDLDAVNTEVRKALQSAGFAVPEVTRPRPFKALADLTFEHDHEHPDHDHEEEGATLTGLSPAEAAIAAEEREEETKRALDALVFDERYLDLSAKENNLMAALLGGQALTQEESAWMDAHHVQIDQAQAAYDDARAAAREPFRGLSDVDREVVNEARAERAVSEPTTWAAYTASAPVIEGTTAPKEVIDDLWGCLASRPSDRWEVIERAGDVMGETVMLTRFRPHSTEERNWFGQAHYGVATIDAQGQVAIRPVDHGARAAWTEHAAGIDQRARSAAARARIHAAAQMADLAAWEDWEPEEHIPATI